MRSHYSYGMNQKDLVDSGLIQPAYLNFLDQILQVMKISKGNPQFACLLLQPNFKLLDDEFAQVLRIWATINLLQMKLIDAESIASDIVIFCNWIQSLPQGSEAGILEVAITGYEVSALILTQENCKEEWAEIQNNLGVAYRKRIRGNRGENLNWGIRCLKQALTIRTQKDFPKDWAETQNNLGNAYCDHIYGDRVENMEKAVDAYQAALEVYTTDDKFLYERARTQNSLGTAYQEQALIGDRKEEKLQSAIAAYRSALKVRKRKTLPQEWATTIHNLGNCYLYLKCANPIQNLNRAIGYYNAALTVRTFEEYRKDWAQAKYNLGNAYFYIYTTSNKEENLDLAIKAYNETLKVYTRKAFPQNWADTQNCLAKAYSERWQIDKGIECYRAALKIYKPTTFPIDCLRTGHNLGNTAFNIWRWADAIEGYSIAVEAVEQSREWASRDSRKAEILSDAIDVYCGIVQAYININQLDKAIEYVERSKARNLVELLVNKDIYPKHDSYPNTEIYQTHCQQLEQLRRQIPAKQRELEVLISNRESEERYRDEIEQRRQELNQLQQQQDELLAEINPIDSSFSFTQKVQLIPFRDIQSLTDENTAIVEWYITGSQILTFIITCHYPHPLVVSSSAEDMTALENWDQEYRNSYQNQNTQWIKNLASNLQHLAEILHIDDIVSRIDDCFAQSGAQCNRLILIPHRYLHLFPLHALPVADGKLLFERFPKGVGYAPSCQLQQQVQQRKRPHFQSLFAIQNPTGDLVYSNLEVQAIKNGFQPVTVLKQTQATLSAIDAAPLETFHCAHFSCHAHFNLANPIKSALILADTLVAAATADPDSERYLIQRDGETYDLDKCLTLDKIFSLNLEQCRLVNLSACETGLTDPNSISDEYIGLPSGFLFAGSPSVVSSLWKVKDLSSSFLMMKFYEILQQQQKQNQPFSSVIALNHAQQWLRNLTCRELEQEFATPQFKNAIAQLQQTLSKEEFFEIEDAIKSRRKKFQKLDPNDKPFANPYYWAAFIATGV